MKTTPNQNTSWDYAGDEFSHALNAILDRATDNNELYSNVVLDQLLFVAVSQMLEAHGDSEDGQLEAWCDEMIALLDQQVLGRRGYLDKLMKDQEEGR